mmetsp:Transcript_61874/g.180849  ORF Transcript_61874/g.180849 Transcript_61874/m.180849 type:complete len:313 (-) Transcript_61874:1098-2036(-)
MSSRWSRSAWPRVMAGGAAASAERCSTPVMRAEVRSPSRSVSSRDVKPPAAPARRTSRARCTMSGRRSLVASISRSSRRVALGGTATVASSAETACRIVTSTSGGSSPSCPDSGCPVSGGRSGASTSLSNWLRTKPFCWNSSSPSNLAKAFIMSTTPLWSPAKPYRGSTTLCTVRSSACLATLSSLVPVPCFSSSSRSALWNPSSSKPFCSSRCRPRACSLVRPAGASADSAPSAASRCSWGGGSGAASRRSRRLSSRPLRWKSSSSKTASAAIIWTTPLWLPSKPYVGSTALCTVRKSFWRSTRNSFESLA